MKALILEKKGLLILKEVEPPEADSGEEVYQVTHCALCRTDAKMWNEGQRDLVLPRILGHEIAVIDSQSNKYVVWPGISCKQCEFCQTGKENLCNKIQIIGFNSDGGLADSIRLSKESLIKLPPDLSSELACLAEPLACTINAFERSRLQKNQNVLIYGAGPVGLLAALVCKKYLAVPFIKEINPVKFLKGKEFIVNTGIQKYQEEQNVMFDLVLNATPAPESFIEGINLLKKSGTYCLFSGFTKTNKPFSSDLLNQVHYKQLNVIGAYGCTKKQMEKALNIINQYQKHVRFLIEKEIQLNEVDEAFVKILSGNALKYIVKL
jgi:D-arabinose 1-dehydrogenase-like Zn-dependent alcohol dehydrogenase